jgi:hypothetical protein
VSLGLSSTGVASFLASIAIGVLGLPRAAAWVCLAVSVLLLGGRGLWLVARRYELRWSRRPPADQPFPFRDDRRDLADDLRALAQRVDDWWSRHEMQRPSIIERNAKSVLAEMVRVAREEPERFEAHRQATRYYDRVMRTEYALTFQPEALRLFDAAVEVGAVTPKARHRVQRPDVSEIRQLPTALRDLAARVKTLSVAAVV